MTNETNSLVLGPVIFPEVFISISILAPVLCAEILKNLPEGEELVLECDFNGKYLDVRHQPVGSSRWRTLFIKTDSGGRLIDEAWSAEKR